MLSHDKYQKSFKRPSAPGEEFCFTSHLQPKQVPFQVLEFNSRWKVTSENSKVFSSDIFFTQLSTPKPMQPKHPQYQLLRNEEIPGLKGWHDWSKSPNLWGILIGSGNSCWDPNPSRVTVSEVIPQSLLECNWEGNPILLLVSFSFPIRSQTPVAAPRSWNGCWANFPNCTRGTECP